MKMTKHQFLTSSGVEVETLEFWLEQEWLIPGRTSAGMRFSEVDIARAHLIQQLKNGIGANDEGIGVILHLMDQLHGMRNAMARLRDEIQRSSD